MRKTSLGVVFAIGILFVGCDKSSPIGPTVCGGPANPCITTPPTPTVWTNPDTSMHQFLDYQGKSFPMSIQLKTVSPPPGSEIIPTLMLDSSKPCFNTCFSFTLTVCVDTDQPMYLNAYWSVDGVYAINNAPPDQSYFSPAGFHTTGPISRGCVDVKRDMAGFNFYNYRGPVGYIIWWGTAGSFLDKGGITANHNGGSYVFNVDYRTVS